MPANLYEALQQINTSIQQLGDRIDERFDRIDERFDRVNERFDRMNEQFDEIAAITRNNHITSVNGREDGQPLSLFTLGTRIEKFHRFLTRF
jgi:DNA anti-recombination protein RmuC